MNTLVSKTKVFHIKHGFTLDRRLTDLPDDIETTVELEEAAMSLLQLAAHLEQVMVVLKDPRIARTQLMVEELGEVVEALRDKNEESALDGLSDLAFVTIGTCLAFDLPFIDGLTEVCDSNLTKDKRSKTDIRLRDKGPSYRPPNMKHVLLNRGVNVIGIRTHCTTEVVTNVKLHITCKWLDSLHSKWIFVNNGVTGYESMKTTDVLECYEKGWYACAGTKGRWDKLFIPADQMILIGAWLTELDK